MRFMKWLHPGLHIKRWLFLWFWKIEQRHREEGWGYLTLSRGVAFNREGAIDVVDLRLMECPRDDSGEMWMVDDK